MKLSLIIPTYNRPKDVIRLMTNLNLQTRKPDEVIIIDASETDETMQLVEGNMQSFAYPVHYYRHEKGLTRQRNFGLGKAQYDIIGFSDDDVLFEPPYLEKMFSIFEEDDRKKIGGASGFVFQVRSSNIPTIDSLLKTAGDGRAFLNIMAPFKGDALKYRRSKWREKIERLVLLHGPSDEEGTYCSSRGKLYGICTPFSGIKETSFLMGIAFYRKEIFDIAEYSTFFEGYGFAEDAHFSLCVGKHIKLVVDGDAGAYHLHAPSGRPDLFTLGKMTARNRFHTFRVFSRNTLGSNIVFWYFFWVESLLDLLPAFLGRGPLDRTKLVTGRFVGCMSSILEAAKKDSKNSPDRL